MHRARFAFLWYEVDLAVDDAGVLASLEPLWSMPDQTMATTSRLRFDLVADSKTSGPPTFTVFENGDRLVSGLPSSALLGCLYSRLHMRTAEISSRLGRVRLHAATVDLDDHRILLVGASGAGKTTTALTMATQGCRFVGDECALINGGRALAVPRFAHVKAGTGFHIPALADMIEASQRLDEHDREWGIDVALFNPRMLGGEWQNDERPVSLVVYLLGFGSEESGLVSTERALPLLLDQVMRVVEPRPVIVRAMSTLLRQPMLTVRVPAADRVLPLVSASLRRQERSA